MKSLGEFIVEKQAEYPHARGSLGGVCAAAAPGSPATCRSVKITHTVSPCLPSR